MTVDFWHQDVCSCLSNIDETFVRQRVQIKVYRLAKLFYKKYGHVKYAYAVLYLSQIKAILSESEAHDLKWNRFHNKFGGKGKNIPLDLKKEQQNKVLKTTWKGLGSNLSEQSAS